MRALVSVSGKASVSSASSTAPPSTGVQVTGAGDDDGPVSSTTWAIGATAELDRVVDAGRIEHDDLARPPGGSGSTSASSGRT